MKKTVQLPFKRGGSSAVSTLASAALDRDVNWRHPVQEIFSVALWLQGGSSCESGGGGVYIEQLLKIL